MTIIWCMVPMVPEIWSVMDRVFCHFGLFFALPSPPPTSLWNCAAGHLWSYKILKRSTSVAFPFHFLSSLEKLTLYEWEKDYLYASRLMVNNLTKLTKILTKIYFRNTGRIKNFSWYKKIWEEKKRFAKYLVVCKIF